MLRNTAFTAFLALFLADFTVRSAYMAGKSPVLPVFAEELGANEIVLGAIVSISTLTGVLFKPFFGFLSDRHGQWVWLMIGTVLFSSAPVLYLGVSTTQELISLRLAHGLATAIYGPVTLAFVADLGDRPRAEWFGWFGLARTGGYVVGPLIGGALLSVLPAAAVFASTSLIAVLALAPVVALRSRSLPTRDKATSQHGLSDLPQLILRNRPLLMFGVVEMSSRIGIYAVKTFLPLLILAQGGTPLEAGLFLSMQELAVAITRPIAGRVADRLQAADHVAIAGLFCMAAALATIPTAASAGMLVPAAILIGIGNGAFHPAALALIASASSDDARGVCFGIVGALRNVGKLLGPIIGGVLLYVVSPEIAFMSLALLTLIAVIPIALRRSASGRQQLI